MIRIGIFGYGNLGRGVESAVAQNPDMTLSAVFTRRDPKVLTIATDGVPVVSAAQVLDWKDRLDVMILCGGSATDLPTMTPELAKNFSLVDSYDNHSSIPAHFTAVDRSASENDHLALISCGWDPGLFSLNRIYAASVLPEGESYTFWGRGVSQGHSDAIRRIPGVLDARQYTVPIPEAMDAVRRGGNPVLTTRQKHRRECYVVAAEDADRNAITQAIVTMPAYFADYDTTVTFISQEELTLNHKGLPHGGSVIRTGITGKGNKEVIEFKLTLDSNPEFTGSVLVAFARAVARMASRGRTGCITAADIAPADLSPLSREELISHMI